MRYVESKNQMTIPPARLAQQNRRRIPESQRLCNRNAASPRATRFSNCPIGRKFEAREAASPASVGWLDADRGVLP